MPARRMGQTCGRSPGRIERMQESDLLDIVSCFCRIATNPALQFESPIRIQSSWNVAYEGSLRRRWVGRRRIVPLKSLNVRSVLALCSRDRVIAWNVPDFSV